MGKVLKCILNENSKLRESVQNENKKLAEKFEKESKKLSETSTKKFQTEMTRLSTAIQVRDKIAIELVNAKSTIQIFTTEMNAKFYATCQWHK
jgi:hypothetical protein